MDDVVYRELAILRKNCRDMSRTIRIFEAGLRNDPRFARLRPVRETPQSELFADQNKAGPEGLAEVFD